MFLTWLKRCIVFILLIFFRKNGDGDFRKKLTKNCKKRQRFVQVPGISEELDEVETPPDNCSIDTEFTCFNKDGYVFTSRVHDNSEGQKVDLVTMDIPGIGRYQSCYNTATHSQPQLKQEVFNPMRSWQIRYRGMLTLSGPDSDTTEPLYLTVVLYWVANSDPFDHWSTVPSWYLAKGFDNTPFSSILRQITGGNLVFYHQWGDVSGRITIEGHPDIEVIGWKSTRSRRFADVSVPNSETITTQHVYIDDDGTKITTGATLKSNSDVQRKFGYLTFPIGERWASDLSGVQIQQQGQNYPELSRQCTVIACRMPYNIAVEKERPGIKTNLFGEQSECKYTQFSVNGKQAYGVVTRKTGSLKAYVTPLPSVRFKRTSKEELLVDLRDGPYPAPDVGGKASKLSVLHKDGYSIPSAACFTIHAFNLHVSTNRQLKKAIENIKTFPKHSQTQQLSDICTNAVNICMDTSLDTRFVTLLDLKMKEIFGDRYDAVSVAIRSSAAAEDGQSASFAGQLETFLGISGTDSVLHAIKQCWASNLSYRAVEYRRQIGQPLVEGMGVLIQEMVAADTSGVIFTNEPLRGNPSVMTINATYGLGDTVVSGEVTPDTITVKRRNNDRRLSILETVVGSKGITLHLNNDGGIERKETDSSQATATPCVNEECIIQLCRTGIDIERSLGQAQDIEWAFVDSQLFILQARPITSIEIERDEDMYHEFDSGYLGDNDCLTLANIGEVLPGANSPLGMDVLCQVAELGFKYCEGIILSASLPKYANSVCSIFYNRVFLNLSTFALKTNTLPGEKKENLEIFFVGQPVPEHKQCTILALQGRKPNFFWRMVGTFRHFFIEMQRQPKRFYAWAAQVETFTCGDECNTAASLYDAIGSKLHILIDAWLTYNYMLLQSSTWSGFIMLMMKGDKETLTQEASADMSILLSDCDNVESADVPSALNQLAHAIEESGLKEEFMNTSDGACHILLCSSEHDQLKSQYENFLKRHGHRCIREMELSSKSWGMQPSVLMHQLKLMLKSRHSPSKRKGLTIEEAVDNLNSPLSGFKKFILKRFLVRKAREGVAARERGKSITMRTFNVVKKAFWRLASMMVEEGHIPDERLAFYFTHRELGRYIENPSPTLLMRAKRRMRIRPILEDMRFPLLNFSRPYPTKKEVHSISVKSMTGLPVGQGVATGRACVITSVEEADTIEKGDILICPFTDVGWTPYFPLISGIVTELGGMISHGAVVAREFGLPCVANVQGATSAFTTGDRVKIDGLAGTLELLEE